MGSVVVKSIGIHLNANAMLCPDASAPASRASREQDLMVICYCITTSHLMFLPTPHKIYTACLVAQKI